MNGRKKSRFETKGATWWFDLFGFLLPFLSALFLILDFAPNELFPSYRRSRQAIEYLKKHENVMDEMSPGINIKPETIGMGIATSHVAYNTLSTLIREYSELGSDVDWDRAVGVGYSNVRVQIAKHSLNAFHPLYIAVMPIDNSTVFDLVPVGQLQDLDTWMSMSRQRWVTRSALILLVLGFSFQFFMRMIGRQNREPQLPVSMKQHIIRWLWIAGALALLVLALWKVPQWQVRGFSSLAQGDIPKLENEYRKTVAQIIGGLGLLLGILVTLRRVRAVERNVELAQEGQITERFTRAIDQLGNKEHLEIRLGGIYSLERIARDSKKDHWPIMEVLSAYVREKASRTGRTDEKDKIPLPPKDIQAILTVLGRRSHIEDEKHPLNLEQTNLARTDLSNAHLERVNFRRARLVRANLREAQLEAADVWKAELEDAHLEGAHLEGVDLTDTCGLTKSQIDSAIIDETTKLPNYLKVPDEGNMK